MATEDIGPVQVAQSLLGTSLNVRKDENVIIETWTHTLPYATACVVEARRRGAKPMLWLEDEAAYWRSIDLAPAVARWAKVGRHEWSAVAATDAYVFFPGPADMPKFRSLPEAFRTPLTGYNSEWYRRAEAARLRGVRSVLGYATEYQATAWGVSASAWRNQILRATVEPEPAEIKAKAAKVAKKLQKGKVIRVTGSNGTDLTFRLKGRRPVVDDGVVSPDDLKYGQNMAVSPPGSVAVAIDEKSAEGVVIANRPTFTSYGRLEGGQWEAHGGRVGSTWYTDGQSAFDDRYAKGPKGKDIVSLFSIGINPSLAPGVPRIEDQEAGAVTLGLGGNYTYGGSNHSQFFAWLVHGEATVAVDGTPLCDRGHLL